MEADLSEIFELKTPSHPMPKKARMVSSLLCEACGEGVMETRTRRLGGKTYCIPCFDALEKRF
jgi:formylmethanofuran dehydrogenase subunit E